MHVFSHIEPPEYFLNQHCLLGKIQQVLTVVFLHFLYLELFSRIEAPKQGLNPYDSLLLPEELFSLHKHSELGL